MACEITRRALVGGGGAAAGAAMFPWRAAAQLPLPKSPVSLNLIDATGNLALTQKIIENYRKANPNLVSRIAFTKAPQPELPGKIRAQQNAGRVDIDLALASYDGLTGGLAQNVWLKLFPDQSDSFPKLEEIFLPGAWRIQQQTNGFGLVMNYSPYGVVLEYMPDRLKKVPKTADDLMAWCKENKNRFIYARPANSGPGRALMTALPYILNDANPSDPANGWSKTWAYLKELGQYIEYYPSGTSGMFKEFGDGSRDMLPSTLGWDINPRVLGIVPKEAKTTTLQGFHWVSDAHCWCVPRGVSNEKLAVIFDLMRFALRPEQQAYTYDEGYFYPGPAVKRATLDLAPEESRKIIEEYGRPEYAELIENVPHELPLSPEANQAAFRIWDEQIGGAKKG